MTQKLSNLSATSGLIEQASKADCVDAVDTFIAAPLVGFKLLRHRRNNWVKADRKHFADSVGKFG